MSDTFPRPFNADYELLGILGKGGMGSHVYKAKQIKLNRTVALKVLDAMGNEESERRFFSEAQAMKELNHQNLATVFDYGINENNLFIAMTFINGESLADIIKREKKLPAKRAMYIAWQIARGLEYAHKRGVTHRDIKPSNIMMMEHDEVCIIDFGISITEDTQRLTNAGMTMGTPEYMSPEQCRNINVTTQSDIYSLGIVFYEMLLGDPPFAGGNSLAILNKHLHEKPDSIRKSNAEVSEDLEKIIFKCLEKETKQRYKNFYEFLEDLKTVMSGYTLSEPQKTLVGKLSKAERIMLLILCILPALLILLIFLISLKSEPETPPGVGYLNSAKQWVIESVQPETPLTPLFDGDLGTSWMISKNSALKSNNGILITIKFPKPTLVSHLGIAVGNQSNWDNFQKYNKPKEIWIRHANSDVKEYKVNEQSSIRKATLEDRLGVQYIPWIPLEVTTLIFELKSLQNDSKTEDFAVSEIRIFGMEL
jgi:serine/threonine protein kinase